MAKRLDFTELKNFGIKELFEKAQPVKADIIGQNRAKKALEFGMSVESKGHNIYLAGDVGSGRFTLAKNMAEKKALKKPKPLDICYVHNFKSPKNPILLQLEAGKELQEDMNRLIEELLVEIPATLAAADFELSKSTVVKDLSQERENILQKITTEVKKFDFDVKSSPGGVYFVPIVNGVTVEEEDMHKLTQEDKAKIMKNSSDISEMVTELMSKMRQYDNLAKNRIEEIEFTYLLLKIGRIMSGILEKYSSNKEVFNYLKDAKEDILENLNFFLDEGGEEEEQLMGFFPWQNKKEESPLTRYKINLLVDNSALTNAPVITHTNPTYQTLVGEVEYDSEQGGFVTDFMKIKPGLLHKANGGYLILKVKDFGIFAWEALLRALKIGEVIIEPVKELQTVAVSGINPQKLSDLNVKVILIGNHDYYEIFHEYDEDFRKLFKVRCDFDYEMDLDETNVAFIKDFIGNFSKEFTTDAMVLILEQMSRLSGRQHKLAANFDLTEELIYEAMAFAADSVIVTESHVQAAILHKKESTGLYEEKLTELIDEEIIMISTKGKKIGQINALAVMYTGDYAFAKPTRITATSYAGKSGVINIEKEARLSGRVHDKGVQVLAGYMGNTYAKEFPLALSIQIGFEQNYTGVDGDSASSSECYAIISSIAEIPINQELAVTGSMNQYGEVQAIGGATEKIEGFFDTCEKRGLTDTQGVIIPIQNVRDLVLKNEVIEAVKNGKFHIYAISHVDEGMELLMGMKAEAIHKKTKERLKFYSQLEKNDEHSE